MCCVRPAAGSLYVCRIAGTPSYHTRAAGHSATVVPASGPLAHAISRLWTGHACRRSPVRAPIHLNTRARARRLSARMCPRPLPAGPARPPPCPLICGVSSPPPPTPPSRAGAKKFVYLNFGGILTTGTLWNRSIETPPFDRDGNRNAFSDAELREIVAIWRAVAEDFAPFEVDITTGGRAR